MLQCYSKNIAHFRYETVDLPQTAKAVVLGAVVESRVGYTFTFCSYQVSKVYLMTFPTENLYPMKSFTHLEGGRKFPSFVPLLS
jgi:hypothetical protein